jgi:hypothetical protein
MSRISRFPETSPATMARPTFGVENHCTSSWSVAILVWYGFHDGFRVFSSIGKSADAGALEPSALIGMTDTLAETR